MKTKYEYMRDVLSVMLKETPPLEMIRAYCEGDSEELHEFCVDKLKPEIVWATGISIIETCIEIFQDAVANRNISVDEEENDGIC